MLEDETRVCWQNWSRVGAAWDGDAFAGAYGLSATRAAHAGMKHVKVENSTLWFTLLCAQSLVPATCPRPRDIANHTNSDSSPFRDELSLLDRPKVAEEWSDALLCCVHS